jgi:hypothetical protein
MKLQVVLGDGSPDDPGEAGVGCDVLIDREIKIMSVELLREGDPAEIREEFLGGVLSREETKVTSPSDGCREP